MMKQFFLSAALVSAAFLAGCGGGGGGGTTNTSVNEINFSAAGATGLRPSVLNLASSNDGTINILNTGAATGDNPVVAMNSSDGWSSSQAVILPMTSNNGQALAQPTFSGTVLPVYMMEVAFDRATKLPTGIKKVLVPGTDYSVLANGNLLYLIPLKVLNSGAYYTILLTNQLVDAAGIPLAAPSDYTARRESAGTSATEALMNQLITAQEGLGTAIGLDKQNVIFSDTFKTSSAGEGLRMVKLAASKIVLGSINGNRATTGTDVWKAGDFQGNKDMGNLYQIDLTVAAKGTVNAVLADTAATPQGAAKEDNMTAAQAQALIAGFAASGLNAVGGITNIYKTNVRLPYFLGHPSQSALAGAVTPWKGATPSLWSIVNGLQAGGDTATAVTNALVAAGVNPNQLAAQFVDSTKKGVMTTNILKLVGTNIQVPDGNGGNTALDAERNVTEYNSLPAITVSTNVPVLLFSAAPLNTVDKVVIFQHGITSQKEAVYSIALSLIAGGINAAPAQNIAVIAMDLPLHGERGFPGLTTTSDNPGPYANLKYLAVGRDNLRQSAADLIGLRAALAHANRRAPVALGTANNLKVSFLGHSLGAIVGTNFLAISNEATDYTSMDNSLFTVSETALAMPGGQVAHVMVQSPTFGPIITHDVITAAVPSLKAAFDAFKAGCENSSEKTCFTTQFIPTLPADTQASITKTMTEFSFAAQTVMDMADPMSVASSIVATTPIYMIEVVGDKGDNKADQVIPNAIGVAGTEPLVRQLGLTDLTATRLGNVHHVGRFTKGGHGSVLVPDATFDAAGAATSEMQNELASFFATNGQALPITNPQVVCTDTAANCLP